MSRDFVDVVMSIFAAIGLGVFFGLAALLLYNIVSTLVLYVGGCI